MASPQDQPTALSSDAASIDATPRVGQNIHHDGKNYTTIQEGMAYILVPQGIPTSTDPKMSKEDSQKQQVFYNPIQQFNRDLSVLAIKTFGDDLVARRVQQHERSKQKAARQQEKKKRKLEAGNANGDAAGAEGTEVQAQVQNSKDQPSKRRRTAENGQDVPMTDAAETTAPVQEADAEGGANLDGTDSQPQSEWRPPFSILDALSATGLRALRYAQEIPYATSITANDLSAKATEAIKLNVKHNKLESKIHANTGNAIVHMYSFADQKGYDVIDLDPYGTASPFIDAAIQAINDNGLLCVTCTDSAIFASHGYLEKTYSQYGGLPLKGEPCHEGGLRLLLHAIAQSAGRYGMAIEPLLSLSIDYYIRVFVRVRKQPADVKLLAGKTMIVYHCQNGCGAWSTQYLARNKPKKNKDGTSAFHHGYAQGPSADSLCEHCGTKTHLSGPMYGGPIHNPDFITRVLAQLNASSKETYPTHDRIEGMLHTAIEEITYGVQSPSSTSNTASSSTSLTPLIPKADPSALDTHPFFFIPSSVAKVLHCQAPPTAAVRGALLHAGFRVTMSHCKPGSIRTDASWSAIWHIFLEWIRQKAPLKKELKAGTAGAGILSKATAHKPKVEANEKDAAVEAEKEAKKEGEAEKEAAKEEETPAYLDQNFKVVFDEKLGRDHDRGKYVRYQLAPRENWGPMARAR